VIDEVIKGGYTMIIMNLELDNIYGFNDFRINFSYPKKIVNSNIPNEHLKDCPKFRYKKAVILMGANATGKTTLGRALLRIFGIIETGNPNYFTQMIRDKNKTARICIEFINGEKILNRLTVSSEKDKSNSLLASIVYKYESAPIRPTDTYEKVLLKMKTQNLDEKMLSVGLTPYTGQIFYSFALDNEENNHQTYSTDPKLFLKVLKAVIGTLDPSLKDISILDGVENSYVIRRGSQEIILQNNKLVNQNLLSSGTVRGVDIALLIASIIANERGFYYCDEHFSYIQTDLEKRMFGIMIEHLQEDEQLIFTTHNTDMLDLNIPKHSYAFLSRNIEGDEIKTSVMYASDVLKRNTDSIRCAAANDVFSSIPDESLLDSLSED
jgi:ABC-type transport system involved in cytochrome c biogenesis ATPase subunit